MTELPSIFEVQLLIKFKAARSKPKRRKLLLAKCYGYECFARSPRRQRGPAREEQCEPCEKIDCLQSAFSLKILLVLISSSAIANHDFIITETYALVSRGSRLRRSRA